MEYDTRTYFDEQEEESVNGFVVIGSDEESEEYHLAEKWNREDKEAKWIQYWIPQEQLARRVEQDKCEPKAELSQKQYEKVCDNIDHSGVVADPATA